MAWTFALSAECGARRDLAEAFANHYRDRKLTLSDCVESRCSTDVHIDELGNWWAVIYPSDISRSGVSSEKAAKQLSEVGALLFEHLRSAPQFRYAVVGVESDEFMQFDKVGIDLIAHPIRGLVVSDDIWESLGRPDLFVPFASGYHWVPYQGEVFRPALPQ